MTGRLPTEADDAQPKLLKKGGRSWLTDNPRRLDLAVAVQVVAQSTVLFLLVRRGFFYFDDILNLRLAQVSPLHLGYLMIPNFQHVEPGVRFEYWIVAHVIGLHYQIVSAIVVLLIGLATWVLYRVQRLLFPPSMWMMALNLLFGLWIGWLGAAAWLAGAFEVVPSSLASAIAIYAFCRRLKGGGDFWIAITGAAFASGLAFYEGTMVVIPSLVLLLLAVGLERTPPREWNSLIRLALAPLAWCVVAAAAFIAVFISKVQVPVGQLPTPGALLGFLLNSWSKSFVPGLFGGPVNWAWTGSRGTGAAPLNLAIACQAVLLLIVAVTVWRTKGRALAGWALVVIPFALLLGLVGWARLHQFGLGIGLDYQYAANVMAPVVVGLMFVFMGRHDRSDWHSPVHLRGEAVVGVALCGYLAAFCVSAVPFAVNWSHNSGRTFLSEFQRSAAVVSRRAPNGWSLYDTDIPANVLFQSAWPYDSISDYSKLWGIDVPIDDSNLSLYVVNSRGAVLPARFEAVDSTAGRCAPNGRGIILRLPRVLPGGVWTITVEIRGSWGSQVGVAASVGPDSTFGATLATGQIAASGRTTILTVYSPQQARRLYLTGGRAGTSCAAKVNIGYPVSAP